MALPDFSSVYTRHSTMVMRICKGYTGDEDAAMDLFQETWIKLWENLHKFRGEALLSTWIYRVTVNTCLGFIRKEKKQETTQLQPHFEVADDQDGKHKEAALQKLHQVIHLLAPAERLIISMVLEELPYQQIAEVLQMKEGNLRVKIHRIKQQLTKLYFSEEDI